MYRAPAVALLVLWAFPVLAQETPIHQVQGSGNASALAGQSASVKGVVTAIKSNGFYVQTEDGAADADPATSEGLFVFTSSAPAVAKQQRVRVTGRVTEFRSASDSLAAPLTELTAPIVEILAAAGALPSPVVIDPRAGGGIEQLERFEGMRVVVRGVVVVGPTDASRDERTGSATSRGVFYVTPSDSSRPFAEKGIDIRLPLPAAAPCCIARFDANPERLRVDSDGQIGVAPADVAAGTRIGEIIGVLDYANHDYTILPDATLPSAFVSPTALSLGADREFRIATSNLLRLYDDLDDPATGDSVTSTSAYELRLEKLSRAIVQLLASPDVIGVQEVESLSVLQRLATRVLELSGGATDYDAYVFSGNDPSALNVGILARRGRVNLSAVEQIGKEATFTDPRDGSIDLLFDRPPLRARVQRGTLTVTLFVNHLRSLVGVDESAFARAKRAAQAEFLARAVNERQTAGERIVVIGDLNAREENDGWVDVIGTIIGRPAPPIEVVLPTADLVERDLVRLASRNPALDYTFVHEGNAESLDHIIVSGTLLPHVRDLQIAHINADFPEVLTATDSPVRTSDHDIPIVTLSEDIPSKRRPATPRR